MKSKIKLFPLILCIAVMIGVIFTATSCGGGSTDSGCTHVWGEWEEVTPATCESTGLNRRVCQLDSTHVEELTMPKLAHTYGEEWKSDETSHYKECTCGAKGETAEHTFDDGVTEGELTTYTCTVCSYEKKEVADSHTHTYAEEWSTDDSYHWHECSCGDKSGVEEHSWNDGEVTTAATCGEDGVKTYTCTVCEATKTEKIDATGEHSWNNGEVTTAATCTTDGVKTFACTVCDATKTETIPASHAFAEEWTKGETTHWHDCANCDAKSDENGHTWNEGEITTAATCGEEGVKTFTCTVCGATKTEPVSATGAHTWNDGAITTAPTCAENGVKTFTCTVCGATKTESVDATGDHVAGSDWVQGENSHYNECTVCGVKMNDTAHDWDDGVIEGEILTQTCNTCGKIKTSDHEHTYSDEWEFDEDGHWHECEDCDDTDAYAPHDWDDGEITTAATCGEDGVMTYTCTVCEATKEVAIDATGEHDWDDGEITTAPTCTEDGEKLLSCTVCDATKREIVPASHDFSSDWTSNATHHWHVCANCDVKGDENGHVWDDGEITTEAGCGSAGVKTYTCTVCEATKEVAVAATGDHDFSNEWSHEGDLHWHQCNNCSAKDAEGSHYGGTADCVNKAHCSACDQPYGDIDADNHTGGTATCLSRAECTRCGEEYGELDPDNHVNKTEFTYEVNADDPELHNKIYTCCGAFTTESHSGGNATCGDRAVCSFCEASYGSIDSAAHDMHLVPGKDVTCDADGASAYYHCSICNKDFADEEGSEEVDPTELVIEKLNHKNETSEITKAATCGVAGVRTYTCPDCDRVRTEAIDALEHNYVENADEYEAPTCLEPGASVKTCANCGDDIITPVDALGHEYSETAEVITAATCTVNGVLHYACTREGCESYKEEITPKAEHDTETTSTPATCTAEGYVVTKCKNCSFETSEKIADKLAHDWIEDAGKAATCTTDGYRAWHCSSCSETKTEKVNALQHSWVAATCTDAEYCSTCGDVGASALSHDFENGTVVDSLAATCTEDGYEVRKCSRCDQNSDEQVIKAAGHSIVGEWTESEVCVDADNCIYVTRRSATCSVCGTVNDDSAEYENHKLAASIKNAAKCNADGVKTYTCSECGYTEEASYEDTTAHKWEDITPLENGHNFRCEYCEETKYAYVAGGNSASMSSGDIANTDEIKLDGADISFGEGSKDKLTGDDINISVGKIEDKTEIESLIPEGTAQDLIDRIVGQGVLNLEVFVDDVPVGDEASGGFGGKVTVRIPYTLAEGDDPNEIVVWYLAGTELKAFEATYVEIDTVGYATFETEHFSYYTVTRLTPSERCAHFGHKDKTETVVGTCLTDGYTLTTCLRCGRQEISDVVTANGHNWVTAEKTDVSCETNGYEKRACSKCGVFFEIVTVATGHSWTLDESASTLPSCTETGSLVYNCSCGASYSTVVPVTEHAYETVVTEATCTTSGYTTYTCSDCGNVVISDYVDALGHDFKFKTVEATCNSKGYKENECKRCDYKYIAEEIDISPDAHEWGDEADCENDQLCKHCKKINDNGKKKGHYYENGICKHCGKECDHNFKESVTVLPTCQGEGYTLFVCKKCGAEDKRNVSPAVEHDYKVISRESATCATEGHTTFACVYCEDSYTEVINKVDHDYHLIKTVAPTCQSVGYEIWACSYCECEEHRNETPVAEHSFTLVTTVPATCTSMGYDVYKCVSCGCVENQNYTDVTNHNLVLVEKVAATCQNGGYEKYLCGDCGYSEITNETPKTSHNLLFVETVAPTCTARGYDVYKCSYCELTETKNYVELVPHAYEYLTTIPATCTSPEYTVNKCTECGKEQRSETAPALEHSFVGGVCEHCGLSSDLFYFNMLDTWSSQDGFAIVIEGISFDISELITLENGEEAFELVGKIYMADVAQLMLYVDADGKLQGAAYGSITIFNGPVADADATYALKALIEDGVVYVFITASADNGLYGDIALTFDVEYFVRGIVEESLDFDYETVSDVFEWLGSDLLPVITAFKDGKAGEINDTVETLVNLVFSYEKTEDGYVYYLNYSKLREINDDLLNLTVEKFIDKYFGEGAYATLTAEIARLLDLPISELADYADSIGLDSVKLAGAINSLSAIFGAPEGFDILDVLTSSEYEGLRVGDVLYMMMENMNGSGSNGGDGENGGSGAYPGDDPSYGGDYDKPSYDDSFDYDADGSITVKPIDPENGYVGEGDYVITDPTIGTVVGGMTGGDYEVVVPGIPGGDATTVPDDSTSEDEEFTLPDSYTELVKEFMANLGSVSLYETMTDDPAMIRDTIDNAIGMLENNLSVEFTTNNTGVITGYSVELSDLEFMPSRYTNVVMSGKVSLIPSGRVDLDLSDLIAKVDELTELPDDFFANKVEQDAESLGSTTEDNFEYNGSFYSAQVYSAIYYCIPENAKRPSYILSMMDCGDCRSINVGYAYDAMAAYVDEITVKTETAEMYFYRNAKTGELISVSIAEGSITLTYADGSSKTFDTESVPSMLDVFPESWWSTESVYDLDSTDSFYYNPTTGELSEDSYHDIEYHYEFMEGSNSCDGGIFVQAICNNCGVIQHSYNTRGHVYEREYSFADGALTSTSICQMCGYNGGESNSLTFIGDIDMTLIGVEDDKKATFSFVADKAGIYELYRINSNSWTSGFSIIISDSEGKVVGECYDADALMTAELNGGETYYLTVRFEYTNIAYVGYTFVCGMRENTVIDVSEYGCACGGTITVYSEFGKWNAIPELNCALGYDEYGNYACVNCGFAFKFTNGYKYGDNCQEIMYASLYLGNVRTGVGEELILYSEYTGRTSHKSGWESVRNDIYDDAGNRIGNEYVSKSVCYNCGTYLEQNVTREYFDESFDYCSKHESEYYYYDEALGELALRWRDTDEYGMVYDALGNAYRKLVSSTYERFYAGELESAEYYTYSYNPECICEVTVNHRNSYGEEWVEYNTEHNTEQRENVISSETGIRDGYDVEMVTYRYENVCIHCGAVENFSEEYVVRTTSGFVLVREYRHYYDSETLERVERYEFKLISYADGKMDRVQTLDYYARYNGDGEIYDAYGYKTVFGDDVCHYSRYELYLEDGEIVELLSGEFAEHRNHGYYYVLHEGSSSCTDGVDEVYGCLACGYEEFRNVNYTTEHSISYSFEYEDGIVYRISCCDRCDYVEGEREEYFTTDFEEELTYFDRGYNDGWVYFEFIPERDGYYNVSVLNDYNYSNLRILDSGFYYIGDSSGRYYGLRHHFVAGETYYISVCGMQDGTLSLEYALLDTVDLSEYGCECGGVINIYKPLRNRNNYDVELNCNLEYNNEFDYEYCAECGFAFFYEGSYYVGDNCAQFYEQSIYVGKNGDSRDTFEKIVIESYATGNTNHHMENYYVLHEGSLSCAEGVDEVYGCINCGYEEYRNENYVYDHVYDYSYECEDGIVYRLMSCSVCDYTEGEREEYFKLDFDEELTLVDRNGDREYAYFKLVPSKTGYYNFYSYGDYWGDPYAYLYNFNFQHLDNDDDGAERYNFAIRYELVAGETYYLAVRRMENATLRVEFAEAERIELSEYGCECGGYIVKFVSIPDSSLPTADVHFECSFDYNGEYQYCVNCGFAYSYDAHHVTDESCNEWYEEYYLFGTEGESLDSFVKLVTTSYLTGSQYHNETYYYELFEGSTSCEQGVYYVRACSNCGCEFSREERYYHNTAYTYECIDGVVYRISNCIVCDSYESVTEEYMTVSSDEDLVYYENEGTSNVWYQFTPTVSGYYNVYSTGSGDPFVCLYNENFNDILHDNDSGERWNFAFRYELTAGTTYYLSLDSMLGSTLHVDYCNVATVDLADYGCVCGGSITVYDGISGSTLRSSNIVLNCKTGYNGEYYVCHECGFAYKYFADTVFDSCYENYIEKYTFLVNEEPVEYVISSYRTGYENHSYGYYYVLHEGSTSCTDGLDEVYGCLTCGFVDHVNENCWREHVTTFTNEYVDGAIYRIYTCTVCESYEPTTEKYFDVKTEENLTYYEKENSGNYIYFEFIPEFDGVYNVHRTGPSNYSRCYVRVYDSDFGILNSWNGYYAGGLRATLTAGETYYIAVSGMTSSYSFNVEKTVRETVDLSEYGCVCGGTLTVYNPVENYESYSISTSCKLEDNGRYSYCTECGFAYRVDSGYVYDDSCNEIYEQSILLGSSADDFADTVKIVITSRKTGGSNHSDEYHNINESKDILDGEGNVIGRETVSGYYYECSVCGKLTSKSETVYRYDVNGNCIYYSQSSYSWNTQLAEAVMTSRTIREYQIFTDANGNFISKQTLSRTERYTSGELSSWDQTAWVFGDTYCDVTRIDTNHNGYENIDSYKDHRTSTKYVPEHSYTEGNVNVSVYEIYCTICTASISMYKDLHEFNENGNEVRNEHWEYESYANSEEDYGYRLVSKRITLYGIFEYRRGATVSYVLSEMNEYYDENEELISTSGYRYEYEDGDYCNYTRVYVVDGVDTDEIYEDTSHIYVVSTYKLSEGSETCLDGLDYYDICLGCDYEQEHGRYWNNDHVKAQHTIETIDLGELSECGGYINVFECPCGEKKYVDNYINCPVDTRNEFYNHGWNSDYTKYNHNKYNYGCSQTHDATGLNICGFSYSIESWTSVDENCYGIYNTVWTFGTNTDTPIVITSAYRTNGTLHRLVDTEVSERKYEIEGYSVNERKNSTECAHCGMKERENVYCDYYDLSGKLVYYTIEEVHYSNGTKYRREYRVQQTFFDADGRDVTYNEIYYEYEYFDYEGNVTSFGSTFHEYEMFYKPDGSYVFTKCVEMREKSGENRDNITYTATHTYEYELFYDFDNVACDYLITREYYVNSNEHTEETLYDYSVCRYAPIVTHIYNGVAEEPEHSAHSDYGNYNGSSWSYVYNTVGYPKYSTCLTAGTKLESCKWCHAEREAATGIGGHYYQRDYNLNMYVCLYCGLQNFTGNDGYVRFEDLTGSRGNGESYVVAYYNNGRVNLDDYELYVELYSGQEWIETFGMIATMSDGYITLSVSDLMATIEAWELDVSLCEVNVRFSLVPKEGTGAVDYDYGITLNAHLPVYTASVTVENGSANMSHSAVCALCGETVVENVTCYRRSYNYSYTRDGISYRVNEYYCQICDEAVKYVEYTLPSEEDTCKLIRYRDVYYGYENGEFTSSSLANVISTYDDHSYAYTHIPGENGELNNYHSAVCTDCGYTVEKEMCDIYSSHSSYIDENGIEHSVYDYHCDKCGYKYRADSYDVQTQCSVVRYRVLYWDMDENGEYTQSELTTSEMGANHTLVPTVTSNEDGTYSKSKCCTACGETVGEIIITVNSEYELEPIVNSDYPNRVFYKFVPTVSGTYIFYSSANSYDTYGHIFNADFYEIASDDDGAANSNNFRIVYYLDAGTTYYLASRYYSEDSYNDGRYTVNLEKEKELCSDHVLGEYTYNDDATCTSDGTMTAYCTNDGCDYADTVVAEGTALGHSFGEWVYNNDASCTSSGTKTRYCEICKRFETVIDEEHPATGEHAFSEWTYNKDAGCTFDGTSSRYCFICGHTEMKIVEGTATGHSYSEWVEIPDSQTCQQPAMHERFCYNCGITEKEQVYGSSPLDHVYVNVIARQYLKSAATTESPAIYYQSCQWCGVCGESTFEYGSPLTPTDPDTPIIDDGTFYLNMLESWSHYDGVAVRLTRFDYLVERISGDEWDTEGIVEDTSAELMLYVDESGELCGGINATLDIYNGPITDAFANLSVQGIIDSGYFYLYVDMIDSANGESIDYYTLKLSVKDFIAYLLDESLGMPIEAVEMLADWATDYVVPVLEAFKSARSEDINSVVQTLVELVFSVEDMGDYYVYTLDFDRIKAVNADLATLTISEVVDKYFGEGSYATVCDFVNEVLNCRLADLPALLDSYSVDSALVATAINTLAEMTGGESFDIIEFINAPEYADFTVAYLLESSMSGGSGQQPMPDNGSDGEVIYPDDNLDSDGWTGDESVTEPDFNDGIDDEWIAVTSVEAASDSETAVDVSGAELAAQISDMLSQLADMNLYELMAEGDYDVAYQMRSMIDEMIDVVSDMISFSFTAGESGVISDYTVSVSMDDMEQGSYNRFDLALEAQIILGGRIDTYYAEDLIEKVDSYLSNLDTSALKDYGSNSGMERINNYFGEYEYNGVLYEAQIIEMQCYSNVRYLSASIGISAMSYCRDWMQYEVICPGARYSAYVTMVSFVSGEANIVHIYNGTDIYSGEFVELKVTGDDNITIIHPNGEKYTVSAYGDTPDYYGVLMPTDWFTLDYDGGIDNCTVMVNTVEGTLHYGYVSDIHDYQVDDSLSTACKTYYVCSMCGESYYSTYHEWIFVEEESNIVCGGESICVYVCNVCGEKDERREWRYHEAEYSYSYDGYAVLYNGTCVNCGEIFNSDILFTMNLGIAADCEYVDSNKEFVTFTLTSYESGYVAFYSKSWGNDHADPEISITNTVTGERYYNDDVDGNLDFYCNVYLEEGVEYNVKIGTRGNIGSFDVCVEHN